MVQAPHDRTGHWPDHLDRNSRRDRQRRRILQGQRFRRLARSRAATDVNRGRTVLGPISERGNRYLRMLFVQAARSVLLRPQSWEKHGLKSWIEAAVADLIGSS